MTTKIETLEKRLATLAAAERILSEMVIEVREALYLAKQKEAKQEAAHE